LDPNYLRNALRIVKILAMVAIIGLLSPYMSLNLLKKEKNKPITIYIRDIIFLSYFEVADSESGIRFQK
jgi:hypothetical protein